MKHSIATFAPTLSGIWIADAARTNTLVPAMVWPPEKRPTGNIICHLLWRLRWLARVGGACSVLSFAISTPQLVVDNEDGERLGF